MNKVIKDARLMVLMKLMVGYIAVILLWLPLPRLFYDYPKIRLCMIIIAAIYLVFVLYTICMHVKFVMSVKRQIAKYKPITDFEIVERNMGSCIDINDYWILAPSQGVAICKQAFESAKMRGLSHLIIRDVDGHNYHISILHRVQIDYLEDINTWAYSEEIEDQLIFPNSFRGPSMFANILLLIICVLMSGIYAESYKYSVAYLRNSYYADKKKDEIMDELKQNSIFDEQLFDKYTDYVYYNSYVTPDFSYLEISVDTANESYVVENRDITIACYALSFQNESGQTTATASLECIRPNSSRQYSLKGVNSSYVFDEYYRLGNYYGSYTEKRNSNKDNHNEEYINMVKPVMEYSDAVNMAKNVFAENIIVNAGHVGVYFYSDDRLTKYEGANGNMNYNTESATYYAYIDSLKETIEMYKVEGSQKTLLDTITMSISSLY